MSHITIAWIILGVFSLVSLFGRVKISGSYISNPIVKMIVGPIIILLAGALMCVGGAIMASPIILFYKGYALFAWIILGVFSLVSLFGRVKISGSYISNPIVKMIVGPIIILLAGALMCVGGAIMASPILLFVF